MSEPSAGDRIAEAAGPSRELWWIAGGIVALVVVAVASVLLAGSRPAATFDEGTPERALQQYLAAFEAGDYDAAYGYFSTAAQAHASASQYRAVIRDYGSYGMPNRRVIVDGRSGSGDHVILRLTVEETSGGGLGTDVYRSPREVAMVREAGSWRIDALLVWLDPGPWPVDKPI